MEVGEAGAPGLDVRGLEGGQDEGHLSAVRRQLGQQVIVHNRPISARLLPRRRRPALRDPQLDHWELETSKNPSKTRQNRKEVRGRRQAERPTLQLLLLPPLHQAPAAVLQTLHLLYPQTSAHHLQAAEMVFIP